jgi:hypothetical protein
MVELKRLDSGHGGLPGMPVLADMRCICKRGTCHVSVLRTRVVVVRGKAVVRAAKTDRVNNVREIMSNVEFLGILGAFLFVCTFENLSCFTCTKFSRATHPTNVPEHETV